MEDLMIATGHYVNFFSPDGSKELFIILNEPNEVNTDLYILIENTVTEHFSRYKKLNKQKLLELLDQIVPCGVQIINKGF